MSSAASELERFEHGGGALIDEAFGRSSGPHMALLHGWGGSRDSLRGIGALFQAGYRIHLIDLPGFGEAPPPPADWSTPNYTDLIQQYFVDRVQDRIVLVGHSFGARVSLRLAARHLSQISGIVLMAAPGLPQSGVSRVRLRRSAIRLLRKLLVALGPLTGPRPLEWHTERFGSKDYLAAGVLRPLLVRTVNENLADCARQVDRPVLLLWGSDDQETPPQLAAEYCQLMDGHATIAMLPHKDHHLYTGTGAHLCAFKIREWLEDRVRR